MEQNRTLMYIHVEYPGETLDEMQLRVCEECPFNPLTTNIYIKSGISCS